MISLRAAIKALVGLSTTSASRYSCAIKPVNKAMEFRRPAMTDAAHASSVKLMNQTNGVRRGSPFHLNVELTDEVTPALALGADELGNLLGT
jgi:hypothetical protein